MFDTTSRDLLKSAPGLPGLDADVLDELLTQAHIDLATIRMQQTEGFIVNEDEAFDRVRRLATTFEAYVALELQPERTRAAAFVAGTAHQILARARVSADAPSNLSGGVVDPAIVSVLLFMIAERLADAFEAARYLRARGEPRAIRRAVILSIRELARGDLLGLSTRDFDGEAVASDDSNEHAVDLLYRECGRALQSLAREALSEDFSDDAEHRLNRVIALSAASSHDLPNELTRTARFGFSGPHHLATLILRLIGSVRGAMIVKIPVPSGAAATSWSSWLKTQAKARPFLWTNHLKAIALQYLDQGRSLVMTSPTGSGKTTLSVLKIAATLCSGKSVVYLAPTHALVDQVESDLTQQVSGLEPAASLEETTLDEIGQRLPPLSVMTPERCLALLGFAPELFADVGLLVFDEFHLISVDDKARATSDGRSLDAMLALLTFMARQKSADLLLLSAMVSNGDAICAWLVDVTGRPVDHFNDPWKPTRQLRSCVIYDRVEVSEAIAAALHKPTVAESKLVPSSPYGLFSLIPGWHPKRKEKLVLRKMTGRKPPLTRTGSRVTSNRNIVAAQIAADYVAVGKRVLIFCADVKGCGSAAKELRKLLPPSNQDLTGEQIELSEALVEEVGLASATYEASGFRAGVHHGDMLPIERKLVEASFRAAREPGVLGLDAIAATSTVAQGLNLPCDVVILAGTDRSVEDDPSGNPRQNLKPHEILNAVGRAGRAAYAATGLGIVIPGNPIAASLEGLNFPGNSPLPIVFSDNDACEAISDPLELLLDRIEADPSAKMEGLIRRLSDVSENAEFGFERVVTRSFGYYLRSLESAEGAKYWLENRRQALLMAELDLKDPVVLDWQKEIAVRNGVPPALVERIAAALPQAPVSSTDTASWMNWVLQIVATEPLDLFAVVRASALQSIFGRAFAHLVGSEDPKDFKLLIDALADLVTNWCEATNLVKIEEKILKFVRANEGEVSQPARASSTATRARRFAIRLAPDFGFLCGLLGQVYQGWSTATSNSIPPIVDMLPQMIRNGDRNRHHAVIRAREANTTRVSSHKIYMEFMGGFDFDSTSPIETIRDQVDTAYTMRAFSDVL
ncbi:DEAD/DEAH box helicase [Sinorhizobium medicae]|uniref:DEAD/DEAH box helicase n=1 Tax=Sinorhizobium medicae TaxID=110321 RepID=UPI000C7BCCE9|nr:DEAD/DEAH box helicase [Sinorhizobium medicae]PLT82569.1 DEAD/DEAH box helicase [Sinorhizobium medicae]